TGVGNFATFSEVAFDFRVSPSSMLAGIIFALVVGAIGGLFPAGSAARQENLTALREVLRIWQTGIIKTRRTRKTKNCALTLPPKRKTKQAAASRAGTWC